MRLPILVLLLRSVHGQFDAQTSIFVDDREVIINANLLETDLLHVGKQACDELRIGGYYWGTPAQKNFWSLAWWPGCHGRGPGGGYRCGYAPRFTGATRSWGHLGAGMACYTKEPATVHKLKLRLPDVGAPRTLAMEVRTTVAEGELLDPETAAVEAKVMPLLKSIAVDGAECGGAAVKARIMESR